MLMDEARRGQKGTLTRVWARRGTRPRMPKQTKYKWAYIYGAVEPSTGFHAGMVASCVNTEMMGLFLYWLSKEIGEDEHLLLLMDGAGWHTSTKLRVPATITIKTLPPYSPELNPVELVWLWLQEHQLSNRIFADQAELDEGCLDAWNTLTTERIKSLCRCDWLPEI
jgi:putative transposase